MYEELISSNNKLKRIIEQYDSKLNGLEARYDNEIKVMKAKFDELENSCAAKNDVNSGQPTICNYNFL